MTIIFFAIILFMLLVFVGLAVDIGWMYKVKGELQNAADAAALAGAGNIDGSSNTAQTAARTAAVNFAAANKAAYGESVVVASDNTNDLSSGNDITVGFWDSTTQTYDDKNPKSINAVRVRARRTGASDAVGASPGGQVAVFFGQIFRVIGSNFSRMSTSGEAVAVNIVPNMAPIPLCINPTCGSVTPLAVTAPNVTPGIRFYPKKQDGTPNMGWASFFDKNTSKPVIEDYLTGVRTIPNTLCRKCIYTTNGVINPDFCVAREMILSKAQNHTVNGVTVFGWKVIVPILTDAPTVTCPNSSGAGCVTDPGSQPGDAYQVSQFAEVILTDSIPPSNNCKGTKTADGKPGIVIVGTGPPNPAGSNTSTINCLDCNSQDGQNLVRNSIRLVNYQIPSY
jgi:Flp pilus assembly protein TadG